MRSEPDWIDECRERFGTRERVARPHVIEAILCAPIADPGFPVMLEGALQCAAITAVTGRLPGEAGLDALRFVDIPIPIADGDRGGLRVARCSAAEGDGASGQRHVRQRPRSQRYAHALVRETTSSMKAWNVPLPTRAVALLRWHAVVDAERLHILLREVTALGRQRQAGLGHVALWRVTPTKSDRSWLRADGGPARPLPVASRDAAKAEFGSVVQVAEVGFRAPYWHVGARALCALPSLEYGGAA